MYSRANGPDRRPPRPRRRANLTGFAIAATLMLMGAVIAPMAGAQDIGPIAPEPQEEASALVNSELRDIVDLMSEGPLPEGEADDGIIDGNRVLVEVHYSATSAAARALVEGVGGTINGEVEGWLLQAFVPFDQLEALEASAGIRFLQIPGGAEPIWQPDPPPAGPEQATTGSHVVESNADDWQTQGLDGSGVKVGVVDFFNQPDWNAAVASGDLPTVSGTFCQFNGAACSIWGSGDHGNNVSEVIYDMAPGVDLYIATVSSVADLQAAVNYFDSQGVSVISRSLTAKLDGPGNGTGPMAAVIDDAVSKGITWFNSAGNDAGAFSGDGSYWRGAWADADGDGWLEFAPGDELLNFDCAYIKGVRWSDWGDPNATDYNVYVFEDSGATTQIDISTNFQPTADPVEQVNCTGSDEDYLAIFLANANGGTAGDIIEFTTNGRDIQYSSNPYSASGPASDTFNIGAMSVGAIDPAAGNVIASYSSHGPTNDNRIKPDMSAQACLATSLTTCFNGTSSSTPVMAGAAALVIESRPDVTPSGLVSYLLAVAADRGVAGDDNVYGAGELLLPATCLAPQNDDISGARIMSGTDDTEILINTTCATESSVAGETTHDDSPSGPYHSVWYEWIAPLSGDYVVDTAGSNFDTVLGVYSGPFTAGYGDLTVIDRDDDGLPGLRSQVEFTATAGTTYFFAVDGAHFFAVGNVTINLSFPCGTTGPWSATDAASLDFGINCFNAQDAGGPFEITIDSPTITLGAPSAQINNANPVSLTVTGNGNTVDGASLHRVFDVDGSTVAFNDVTIANGKTTGSGGGMLINNGSVTVSDSTFDTNSADVDGGALVTRGGAMPTFTDVTFSNNSTAFNGGAIVNLDASAVVLQDVTLINNEAFAAGGGIASFSTGSSSLTNVRFLDNTAASNGGGFLLQGSSAPSLTNVAFTGNTASFGGGIVAEVNAAPILTNVTFTGNSGTGSAVVSASGSNAVVRNSVIWGDTVANFGGSVTFENSLVAGGAAASGTDLGGNIDTDPLFVDADGPDNIFGTPDDDVRLTNSSPAVNTGLDSLTTATGVTLDLDNNNRFVGSAVDMGAYENQVGCPPPANDNFANRTVLIGTTASASADNTCATSETGEPDHSVGTPGLVFHTVWWEWTPSATGIATIDTTGSTFLNSLGVYTGSPVGSLAAQANGGNANPISLTVPVVAGTAYKIAIDGYNVSDAGTAVLNISLGPAAMSVLPAPCPVLDTTGPSGGGPLSGTIRTVQVTGLIPGSQGVPGSTCVPSGATAVVVTASALNPTGPGNLRLAEALVAAQGGAVNYVSNGLNNANTVTVPVSPSGQVDISANGSPTDGRLVVIGYYSNTGTLRYNPLNPCAVADSRTTGANPASAPFAGPFAGGSAYPDIDVVGLVSADQGGQDGTVDCGVPATADSVVVNLVAIRPQGAVGFGGPGFLSAATQGVDPFEPVTPFADLSLNNATSITIPLNASGQIAIDIDQLGAMPVSAHVRVVVLGYLESGGDDYTPVNPCAAFDTRPIGTNVPTGIFLGKRVHNSPTTYEITGAIPADQGGETNCAVPVGASSVLINLVAIQADYPGNLKAYATGGTPTGGVVNFNSLSPAMNNSNTISVPLDGSGRLDIDVNSPLSGGALTTDIRGVILGYYD